MTYQVAWMDSAVLITISDHLDSHDLHKINEIISGDERFDQINKRVINCLPSVFF